jgi:hypothetical protein
MLQEQCVHATVCGMPTVAHGLTDPMLESLAHVNSSRRKQSKPVRVFSEDKSNKESTPAIPTECENMDIAQQKSAFSLFRNDTTINNECNGVPSLQEKNEVTVKVSNASNNGDSTHTELYSKPSFVESDFDGMSSASSNNNDASFRSRIFHKDAYCELCNREFCNKYFLKTHKANKHGHGAVSKPDLPALITSSAGTSNGHVTSSSSEGVLVPPYFTVPSLSIPSLPVLPSIMSDSVAKTFGNMDTKFEVPPSLPRPPLLCNTLPTDTFQLQPDKRTLVNSDMEDFCEFCQKHFCNKYYLRKHKLDVHGIFSEKSSSGRRGGGPKMPTYGMPPPMANFSSATSLPPMPPPLSAGLTSMAALDPLGSSAMMQDVNALTNLMFLNPFASPLALVQPPAMIGATAPGLLPGLPPLLSMPSLPGRPFDASALFGGDGVKRSENSGNAFCQLCRKEFYNDYFLNMHLLTKHGLPPTGEFNKLAGMEPQQKPSKSEDDFSKQAPGNGKEDRGLQYLCELCNTTFGGKAELQLHTLQCQRGRADKMHEEQLVARSVADNTLRHMEGAGLQSSFMTARLIDRVVCEICNKEVCNKYFLKTHKQKIHGISVSTLVSEKEGSDSTSNGSMPLNGSTVTSTAHLAPVKGTGSNHSAEDLLRLGIDPESYCDLCKKEFSSKYFLKMHKLNMHGVRSVPDVPVLPSSMEKLALLGSQPVPSALGDVAEQMNFVASTPEKSMVALESRLHNGASVISSRDNDGILLQQRSYKCHHCDKELVNEYFLKAHVLNRHGLLLPALDSDEVTGGDKYSNLSLINTSVGLDLSVKAPKLFEDKLNNGQTKRRLMNEKNADCTQDNKLFKLGKYVKRHHDVNMNRIGNGNYWRRRYQVKQWHNSNNKSSKSMSSSGSNVHGLNSISERDCIERRPVMQTFLMEPVLAADRADGAQAFAKAVISIPVRHEIRRPVQVTFLVTPAHH